MKILAIDTAHGVCSVALSNGEEVIAEKTDNEASRQAERLFLHLGTILKECNLTYQDIEAVAANIGPGSFTGIRIGLAAARGIALAARIPIIGVNGFEALTFAAGEENNYENLLVTFDAKREQVFSQFFSGKHISEQLLLGYNELHNIINGNNNLTIIGDGALIIEPFIKNSNLTYIINHDFKLPNAKMIALTAFNKFKNGNFDPYPTPLYVRPADAKLPKPQPKL